MFNNFLLKQRIHNHITVIKFSRYFKLSLCIRYDASKQSDLFVCAAACLHLLCLSSDLQYVYSAGSFFFRAQAPVAGYGNPHPRTRRLPLRDAALHGRNLPLRIIQGTQSVLLEGV